MAETMAEILSPLFLPFVRQKYLSARQKTNTGGNAYCFRLTTGQFSSDCMPFVVDFIGDNFISTRINEITQTMLGIFASQILLLN